MSQKQENEEKSLRYSNSRKYQPVENKTKRYQERSPNDANRTNINLNEERFSSTKKNAEFHVSEPKKHNYPQEESKTLTKPSNSKPKYTNYADSKYKLYSNEKPKLEIQESSTPNKNFDLLQRNKIKSMYESQSTTHSSNSREFLSKFKKVLFYF